MLCDHCEERPATTAVTAILPAGLMFVLEPHVHLCEGCLAESGLGVPDAPAVPAGPDLEAVAALLT